MKRIRLALLGLVLASFVGLEAQQCSAQGLPTRDTFGDGSVSRSNQGQRRCSGYPGPQRSQWVCVWSTTTFWRDYASQIVQTLRRQGYYVTWKSRVIPYNGRYTEVWDIYAWQVQRY